MITNTSVITRNLERFLSGTECYRGIYQSLNITDGDTVQRLLKLQGQYDFNNIQLYATLIVMAAIFITCPNVMLILGLRKTNKVLTPTKKLFVYLSTTDSLVGLVVLPLYVGFIVGRGSCELLSACVFIGTFSEAIGTFTFLTISVLRYIQTSRPFMFINYRYVMIFLLIEAGLSFAIAMVAFLDHIRQLDAKTFGVHFITLAVILLVVIGSTIVLNILSLIAHRRHKAKLSLSMQKDSIQEGHRQAIHRLILIAVVLALCYLPLGVFYIFVGSYLISPNPNPADFYKELLYFTWLNIPVFINAGLNATIYIVKNKKIIDYYKQFLPKMCKSDSVL